MVKVDTKVLLDDVRARDTALFNAISASDRQSVALFRIYVTMVLAMASAVAAISANADFPAKSWLISAGTVSAIGLSFGCWLCFRAIKTARLAPPGKGAEFWQWATRPDVSEELFIESYLKQSLESQDLNHEVNTHSATNMRAAKALGMWGIGLGVLIALLGVTNLYAYAESYLRSLELFGGPVEEEVVEAVAVDLGRSGQVH